MKRIILVGKIRRKLLKALATVHKLHALNFEIDLRKKLMHCSLEKLEELWEGLKNIENEEATTNDKKE